MDAFPGKHVKKKQSRQKSVGGTAWFGLVTRYTGLFAGLCCHAVVLLLLGMVFSLHDVVGMRYETLLDLVAIFLIVMLVLVWQMRWTYPLSNEVPLIILLLWIVLSSRISTTHCFCCRPEPLPPPHPHHNHSNHSHHHHATGVVLDIAGEDNDGASIAALSMTTDTVETRPPETHHTPDGVAVVVVDTHTSSQSHQDHDHDDDDDDFLLSSWRWLSRDCRAENFNFVFSLLCLAMVVSAFFTELRSSVTSLLFRLSTAALLAVVAVLFLVSPSLCSKFNAHLSDSFATVMRITLFEILWALVRYSRGCERSLSHNYQRSVQMTTRHLILQQQQQQNEKKDGSGAGVPDYIAQYEFTTPRAHNLHMTKLYKYLASQQPTGAVDKRKKSKSVRLHTSTRAKSVALAMLPLGRLGPSGSAGMEALRPMPVYGGGGGIADDEDDRVAMPGDEDNDSENSEDDDGDSHDSFSDESSEEKEIGRTEKEEPQRLQAFLPPRTHVTPMASQSTLIYAQQREKEERELAMARTRGRVLLDVWLHLYKLSHAYRQRYLGGLLSWKNRGHSKHLLHLIDAAVCIWVLLVCTPWLWIALLELVWLLFYIAQCKRELAQSQFQSALLSHVVARDADFGVAVLKTGL